MMTECVSFSWVVRADVLLPSSFLGAFTVSVPGTEAVRDDLVGTEALRKIWSSPSGSSDILCSQVCNFAPASHSQIGGYSSGHGSKI